MSLGATTTDCESLGKRQTIHNEMSQKAFVDLDTPFAYVNQLKEACRV